MNSFSIRKSIASVAVAMLLAAPTSAAPPRLMSRGCLASVVSDLSCADSSIMTHCIAIEKVDVELLATCLEAAGCTPDEAENALWITENCQTGPSSADATQPDREGELRRRSLHGRNKRDIWERADSTTTSTDESKTASATSTSSSSSSVNIGLSSVIVGTTLGIATVAAFGGVFICAWREGAAKRKAKRESLQKESLMANMG